MKLFIGNMQETQHKGKTYRNTPVLISGIKHIEKSHRHIGPSPEGYKVALERGVKVDKSKIDHIGMPAIRFYMDSDKFKLNNPCNTVYWVFPSVPLRDLAYKNVMAMLTTNI